MPLSPRPAAAVLLCLPLLLAAAGCEGEGSSTSSRQGASASQAEAPSETSRMLAWQLAARMVELAITHGSPGAQPDELTTRRSAAEATAAKLGVELAPLPARGASPGHADAAGALAWLLEEAGPAVGAELAREHGEDHEALFKIELLASVNVLLYVPGSERAHGLADKLEAEVARARVAVDTPLAELTAKLRADAPAAEVEAALDALELAIARQLLEGASAP